MSADLRGRPPREAYRWAEFIAQALIHLGYVGAEAEVPMRPWAFWVDVGSLELAAAIRKLLVQGAAGAGESSGLRWTFSRDGPKLGVLVEPKE